MLSFHRIELFWIMLLLQQITDACAWVLPPPSPSIISSTNSLCSTGGIVVVVGGGGSSKVINNTIIVGDSKVMIQEVARTDTKELERMSKFCIDTFYNQNNENDFSIISR
jgi:hypothetical protein